MTAMLVAAVMAVTPASWTVEPPVPHVRDPLKPKKHKPKPKPPPPMHTALASYYALHGGGACGVGDVQSGYRFASLFLVCGQRVLMCRARCVTATMSDHGPYVPGRAFDLNVNLKYAIGCGDLCVVRYRVLP